MTTNVTTAEEPETGGGAFGGLGVLFATGSSTADRVRAVKDFAAAARARLSAATSAAEQGKDVLAERSAQILSDLAGRLPIRTADSLQALYGDDPEVQAQRVITEAGRLAGLVWTAAAAVPGPPPVVQAAKVIAHSAVEIRMVGELYTIYNGANRDAAWLGTVLLSWATGQPVAPGGTAASTVAMLMTKLRSSGLELFGSQSRAAVVTSRGRAGTQAMVRAGSRMQRRMRVHPSMWAQPGTQSAGAAVVEAATRLAADTLAERVPAALVSAARLVPVTSPAPRQAEQPSPSDPRQALAQAWALHGKAAAAAAALPPSEPAAPRLDAAVAAQERYLKELGRRLGTAAPSVAPPDDADGGDAGSLVWRAEAAIDAVEDAGARPRRLQSWSTRRRAATVYVITALVVSALPAIGAVLSSGFGRVALLVTQAVALPWLSLAAGAIIIGPLFRPALGGPVPRHPMIGTWIVLAAHLGTALVATVAATFQ